MTGPISLDAGLEPGRLVGRYRIDRQIGAGGMGAVYAATHVELNKRVAIKTLLAVGAGVSPEGVARFRREAKTAARLHHPHIIDVSDVGEADGVVYMAMALLDGETLASRIDRRGPLPLDVVAAIMLPVCAAVAVAHEAGVVHRDLKPDNVFLTEPRRGVVHPVVLDFGISKVHDASSAHRLTGTNSVMGTPRYMAPEQAIGARDVEAAADQYALGVMLYECATARTPFEADNVLALIQAILHAPVEPPSARRLGLPAAFDRLVMRAMAREPDERFPSVRALGAALLEFASPVVHEAWAGEFGPTSGDDGTRRGDAVDRTIDSTPSHEFDRTRRAWTFAPDTVNARRATRRLWPTGLIAGGLALALVGAFAVPRLLRDRAPTRPPATPAPAHAAASSHAVAPSLPPASEAPTAAPPSADPTPAVAPVGTAATTTSPPVATPTPTPTARGHHRHATGEAAAQQSAVLADHAASHAATASHAADVDAGASGPSHPAAGSSRYDPGAVY